MSPAITAMATRLFPFRWHLILLALGIFAAAVGLVFFSDYRSSLLIALIGPLIVLPWSLACVGMWFHPERGVFRPSSKWMQTLPHVLQSAARGYAIFVLILFALFGLVLWPTFVIWQWS